MRLKAYLEPTFSYGWSGGPEFNTRIKSLKNKRERRNICWDDPRHKFTAPYKFLSNDAFRAIKKMFLVCRGQAHSFLFRDELDYQATNEQFGVGDGTTKTFQLSKLCTADGVSYSRKVYALYKPDPDILGASEQATPTISVGGTPTLAFTVDYDDGTITFDTAPADGAVLRWTGPFSLWVRFNQDWLPFSFDEPEGSYGNIDLIETFDRE